MQRETISKDAFPFSNARHLDPLLKRIGDARIVMLGEASHGTHEYYTWRSAISQRLISEKGFNFIAVEGDWPDCYQLNRFVKGYDHKDRSADQVLKVFKRWPSWMWANWEVVALLSWLKEYNSKNRPKAGFYGLDVYSLWQSMEVLVEYLEKADPAAARIAKRTLGCFSGYGRSEERYALNSFSSSCRGEVTKLLREMTLKSGFYNSDPEAALNTLQNAHIAVEAEKYYSNMVSLDDKTWNIRDQHMMDTLERLLDYHGPSSKAIVWEHNTHVGDARYTDMAKAGMFNIGELARKKFPGASTCIVGFCSYAGSVIAGSSWGSQMQEMEIPAARSGSLEELLHKDSEQNRYFIFEGNKNPAFNQTLGHRAIGVVYHPQHEMHNYVPTIAGKRYDALMYFNRTRALHPLLIKPDLKEVPETYPFNY